MIKLIGGDFISLFCIIFKNEYLYQTRVFIDFKTNELVFIDIILFILLFPIFKFHFIVFEILIEIKNYNGIRGNTIIHFVYFNLIIDY